MNSTRYLSREGAVRWPVEDLVHFLEEAQGQECSQERAMELIATHEPQGVQKGQTKQHLTRAGEEGWWRLGYGYPSIQ